MIVLSNKVVFYLKKIMVFVIICMLIFPSIYAQGTTPIGERIAREAAQWLGTPYGVSDGSDGYGSSVDCSGLVKQVYATFGVSLPRTSMLQANEGELIPLNEMIAGDIVCFMYEDGSIGHVGIYVGGNTMIHSPRPGKTVEFSSYFEDWGSIKAVYGRRISFESEYIPSELTEDIETRLTQELSTPNSVRMDHLQENITTLILMVDSPIMSVNGTNKLIEETSTVVPLIINNRTLLPIRSVAEEFGANVEWIGNDTGEISVKYKNTEITMWINSNAISVNGQIKLIDTPPTIINERTYLPIRYIADEFGWTVEWNGTDRTVTISQL